ncbi:MULTISPECIES: hypothetical protein [Stenotrophomonas]|uniref:hypothetical protein n=1 Tax=Stenotrophomonas TaxID=40323 RepID=UPI0018D291D2|nr:hypothetical protein [Stenotrophomonas sp.]MBH1507363.1 hypothetical protein [Stenotrophomonas maltophilia]
MNAKFLLLFVMLLASLPAGASTDKSKDSQCTSIRGAEMLTASRVVVVGDLNGTNESPAVFHDLACAFASGQGKESRFIGLELPETFDAYFEKPSESLEAMLEDEFWSKMGDGRHSAAMRAMVARFMKMRLVLSGQVKLIALERRPIDAAGAQKLVDLMSEAGDSRALVLIGNAHARKTRMRQQRVDPFALVLQKAGMEVLTLDALAGSGSWWTCLSGCAARPVFPQPRGTEVKIVVDRCSSPDCAYDGYYYVPRLTVSNAWKED